MSELRYYRTGYQPDSGVKLPLDPSARRAQYGKIRPMEEPGFFERLFTRH